MNVDLDPSELRPLPRCPAVHVPFKSLCFAKQPLTGAMNSRTTLRCCAGGFRFHWRNSDHCREKTMTKFALYVPLEAKPGKETEVADFLRSALTLVDAEPGTISWFAIQEGPSSFAIFDTFNDEAGRDAHLNGKVAAALMEKVRGGDLFAKTPEIHKLGILADKLPK
jgi:quinol monooxygenase YgiN